MPNPEFTSFEPFHFDENEVTGKPLGIQLLRPNGEPVPDHWPVFTEGDVETIRGCTLKVAHVSEKHILFELVGPAIIGDKKGRER